MNFCILHLESFPLDQSWSDLIPKECNVLLRGTVRISGWEQMLGKTRRPGSSQQSWNRCCSTVTLFSPGVYLLMSQKKNSKFLYRFLCFLAASYPTLQLFLIIQASPHTPAGAATPDCAFHLQCHSSCWDLPSWWSHGKFDRTLKE